MGESRGGIIRAAERSADQLPEMGSADTLVVSKETEERARRLLAEKGYVCNVRTVPMVCGKDGEEIHSTRILEEQR